MAQQSALEEPDQFDQMGTDRESSTVEKVKNAVSDTAEKAQEKVGEMGRAVQGKIDENRGAAADTLQKVASTLHESAERIPSGEKVANLAHSTAEKVEATARYVREHNVEDMIGDLEGFVRRHPGQSLFMAAAIGFLLGRAFKSEY